MYAIYFLCTAPSRLLSEGVAGEGRVAAVWFCETDKWRGEEASAGGRGSIGCASGLDKKSWFWGNAWVEVQVIDGSAVGGQDPWRDLTDE